MKLFKSSIFQFCCLLSLLAAPTIIGNGGGLHAQNKSTLRFDATKTHQHITGFGGFVCSPGFAYNHMTEAEIKKVWGKSSTVGCNIMRLYIPIGRNAWSQSLNTAKLAKQLGLIVFASPWGQPAEWKTNNSSNARNSEGVEGRLKKENWEDYAKYLDDYVKYLRQNGVELDAISIQNEPDWPCDYAGCLWSNSEIAEFVKTYGRTISCKIIAPETLAVSDSYVNSLNTSSVIDCFDIYGGHQYGGIGTAYKNLAKKGKEIWMTEYLINWNEVEGNERNYDFSKDFFNFYRAINTCMIGDFNAWIHYAAKFYYAMMGDGQRGAGSSGTITKRGYIMAHFAKFVTGMTRIEGNFTDGGMEGSYYLSQTGDTVVAVIANNSDETYTLTADLPFYTQKGKVVTTNKTKSFAQTNINLEAETCRPQAEVAPQSVVTLLFVKSSERAASNMKATTKRFDRIEDMKTTRTTFGTNYKLSNKTKTFDHENPLISTRTNIVLGYLALDNRYSRLVMQVKKLTSAANYTSSQTTLLYVNKEGKLSKHDYGELDLSRRENFSMVFDLSPNTLTDGCIGLVSLTNNNYNSKLSITFGDVYFANEGQYAATLSGAYVADDSYLLDFTTDASCTSIDLSAVTEIPAELPWLSGTNKVVYVPEDYLVDSPNIIKGDQCKSLQLYDTGGDFRPTKAFMAEEASFAKGGESKFWAFAIPFSAQIPEYYRAFVINDDLTITEMRSIPANKPVVIWMDNEHLAPTRLENDIVISGSGEVSPENSPTDAIVRYTYTAMPVYPGDYVIGVKDSHLGFVRVTEASTLPPFSIYAQLNSTDDFIPLKDEDTGIAEVRIDKSETGCNAFDLNGRKIGNSSLQKGIKIIDGKKIMVR